MNIIHGTHAREDLGSKAPEGIDPDWWRGAVIYQIYPRSYQDSNGDGIGDLKGITDRLPYIASLGVDAIWISPFFKSPMLDFGYDVSDYKAVDPMFGTLADFDVMIARAHQLGLKVMIDQVISHSSDQHEWFRESRSSRDNPRADWYVWADAKADGSPPNNWLSIFGGSAWEWDARRCQYYLHNFLRSQPDLNFHNPEVQNALLDTVRFWLERGVDGFRLDTINFYFHSAGLEDNPALAVEKRNDMTAPAVNPYNFQSHLYDKNQPENLEFLRRFRALLDEYPAATAVGEIGDGENGLGIAAEYTSGGDKVHMCYAFEFLSSEPLTPLWVKKVLTKFASKAPDGWACWAFSNHDVMRHASRWAEHFTERDAFLKMTATLILTLRGSVCLYQGEELGLTESVLDFEDLRDPYGIQFWPAFPGRDGCRTPMVWTNDNSFGGFSVQKPWLPIAPEHKPLAADEQDQDKDSLLSHYREVLAFRAKTRALSKGSIQFMDAGEDVLLFERAHEDEALIVAINMTEHETEIALGYGEYTSAKGSFVSAEPKSGRLCLPAFGSWIGKRIRS